MTDSNRIHTWALLSFLLALIAVIGLMASVPPVSRDALVHHLAIPKMYLEHGGIYEMPHLRFSYFPMNVTLLYAIPLYFGNDIIPKFIHFAFALGTAALIYRHLVRRINSRYALLGVLFFLSIPIIVRLSTTVYVDLGLIFFLFAALLYLFDWIESDFRPRYLLVSALFCGLALGTKYNGLIGLFLLGLFVPSIYSRYKRKEKASSAQSIAYAAVFICISVLVFSPWMIQNAVWTGNPLHPLYKSIFSSEKQSTTIIEETKKESTPGMNRFQIRRYIYGDSIAEIVLIPVRVFFQGQDDNPKYFDGRLNPFLFLLPIVAVFGIKSDTRQIRTEKTILLFFSILFLLFACAQTAIRIRYFSPIIPPLIVLSMYGLYYIQTKFQEMPRISGGITKICIFGITFVMLSLNVSYIVSLFDDIQPLQYLSGQMTRNEYIQRFRPEYASMRYANSHLSENHKILGVYLGKRGYYSDIDIEFSITMLQRLAAQAESPGDIFRGLDEKNISHLLINYGLFNRFAAEYSDHEKRLLKAFFDRYTLREFSKEGHGLIRLLQPPDETKNP